MLALGRRLRTLAYMVSLASISLALAIPAHAQRSLLNVPEANTEKELAAFTVAEGFEVNLFASDPMIANPIHMNWDDQGRLWVVGSAVYPQILPGEPASDTITVIEDTDGDGVADKSSLFAENLFIPTGVAPGDGGVYVTNSTEILHLQDTNGDGRADRTRVVLSGFGTEDTHHIVHSLRWGYDGLLYFNQSIYIHSHIETPHGPRTLNAGGIWQFRPETMELEVFARGFVNPWGHHYDEWGQSFATDGAYGEGINYVFPGAAFVTAAAIPRVLQGLNEGTPKHCALEVLSGTHLPEDWRGTMITNDFRGQRVCRFLVTEQDGSYVSVEQPEVLRSTHVSFRPVDVKMGPDGAIYIADWYNPIIQHGEVDFRDPRRDHEHGRIWRITAKGRPLVTPPDFDKLSIDGLLGLLQAPEQWNRIHAKRELKTRDRAETLAALDKALAGLDPASPDFENARLELLWAFETVDAVNPKLLDTLLASSDHRVRTAAVRVLSQWQSRLHDDDAYLDKLAALAQDTHPQVRIEAIRALIRVPSAKAADAAMHAMDQPVDRFLEYALWTTMRDLKDQWLPEADGNRLAFAKKSDQLLYALKAIDGPEAVASLVRLYRDRPLTAEQQREAVTAIGAHGDAKQLGLAAEQILEAKDVEPGQRAALLRDLVEACKRRSVRPDGKVSSLAELIKNAPDELRVAAINAAGVWREESVRATLESLATDVSTASALREPAIESLSAMGGDSANAILESLTKSEQPAEIRVAAIRALIPSARESAAKHAVAFLAESNQGNPTPLYEAFLKSEGGIGALTAALEGATIAPEASKIGERVVSSSGRKEPEAIAALRKAGGLGEAPTELSPADLAAKVEAVRTRGDASRGYQQYRTLDCAQCHSIAGSGGNLGPDMTSIGGSAQVDYLVESILFPGKAIKEGFHSLVVETKDLATYSGIKVNQTGDELILKTATEPELRIPLDTIESQEDGGSLMPVELTSTLLEQEFLDLVKLLSELGRTPDFSAGTGRHVRTWRVLPDTDAATDYLYESRVEAAIKSHETLAWIQGYSNVKGVMPLEDVPALKHSYWTTSYSFLQFTLESDSPGKVALAVAPMDGLRLWANGKPVELAGTILLDIAAGATDCKLIVDRSNAKGNIDVQLVGDPGATVSAKFRGGR